MLPGYSIGLFKSHEEISTSYCRDFVTISLDRRRIAHWLLHTKSVPNREEVITNPDRFIYLKVKVVL